MVPFYEDSFMCDPPKLKEGVFEALEYTKKYRVGLVSVTGVSPGRLVRQVMKEYGILDYFECLSFSDEVKWVKPNVKLYQAATDALGIAPEETVHIGDSMKGDIVGAIDAGMRVIWVKTKEQPSIEGYEPHGVITSLLELPEALRSLE
jgi:putative hydrolase of the HAD superfamily